MEIAQIIGLVIVLLLAIFGGIMIFLKSKKHNLAKWIGLFILTGLGLTWVFGYGYYSGSYFTDIGMAQEGLSDLANYAYYAINFAGDKIVFLLTIGIFYAILLKSKGYKKLVNTLSKNLKGKEIIFVLMSSLLITVMTSIFVQNFIPLIFVPFIISILLSLNLDKITAFAATFGSMLVGVLGQTYGGEGLNWFNYYTDMDIKTGLIYRLIVLVVGFILFNFFVIMHAKKVLKENKENALDADPYKVEKLTKEEEKAHVWPTALLLVLLFVFLILGYIGWEANFNITFFSEMHEKVLTFALKDIPFVGNLLDKINIGDFQPIKALLGTLFKTTAETNGQPTGILGTWTLMHGSMLLLIFAVIIALVNKVKFNDFLSSCFEGMKKVMVPVLAVVGAYSIMSVAYMSPFVPTITNTIFQHVTKFNPYLVSLGAMIANAFQTDFGFTGYVVANFFTITYAQNVEVVYTIFVTIYGLISLVVPSSSILVLGLSYLNIEYKDWMKFAWMFIVGMLIILLVLFTVMTYI